MRACVVHQLVRARPYGKTLRTRASGETCSVTLHENDGFF